MNLPITLVQANVCPGCYERDILNWKKHFTEKHANLVAYHINLQIGAVLKAIENISWWDKEWDKDEV